MPADRPRAHSGSLSPRASTHGSHATAYWEQLDARSCVGETALADCWTAPTDTQLRKGLPFSAG
jgi:hypothetical protein